MFFLFKYRDNLVFKRVRFYVSTDVYAYIYIQKGNMNYDYCCGTGNECSLQLYINVRDTNKTAHYCDAHKNA